LAEYHALRIILGLAEFFISIEVIRLRIGYAFWFGVYMYASAAANLAPALVDDEVYKHLIQIPVFTATLACAFAASFDVFRVLNVVMLNKDRRLVFALAAVCGSIPVAVSLRLSAENIYQAFMISRQNALLFLTVGTTMGWKWVSGHRAVSIDTEIDDHAWLWCAWLLTCFLMASTTKQGMFWMVFEWRGGAGRWRAASDSLMAAQLVLLWLFCANLRRWRSAAKPPGA
jgi:hypothetical protein